jgi:hypothetical protein
MNFLQLYSNNQYRNWFNAVKLHVDNFLVFQFRKYEYKKTCNILKNNFTNSFSKIQRKNPFS